MYAVAATGLVVTYTTSGIFNFAQGAIGMFLAFVFWQLQVDWGMQTFVALLLTVFVAAPLMGAIIEIAPDARASPTRPLVAQIVTTIGLMLALMGLAGLIWDPQETRHIDRFFGTERLPDRRDADAVVALHHHRRRPRPRASGSRSCSRAPASASRCARWSTTASSPASTASSRAGSRCSRGRSGSSMAAIAGIFLAEELATLDVQTLTLLILAAFAAAIIGRLKSLPLDVLRRAAHRAGRSSSSRTS